MNVVYLVTNVRNGKQYVGVTKKGLEKRKRAHKAHVSLVSAAIYRKGRAMKHKFEFVAKTHGMAPAP